MDRPDFVCDFRTLSGYLVYASRHSTHSPTRAITGTLAEWDKDGGDALCTETAYRFLGKVRRRIAQKIPFSLHAAQLPFQPSQFFITGKAVATERFGNGQFGLFTPALEHTRIQTQIMGHLSKAHAFLTG
jgi:hypothetical protein